jgi:hypothetical protein
MPPPLLPAGWASYVTLQCFGDLIVQWLDNSIQYLSDNREVSMRSWGPGPVLRACLVKVSWSSRSCQHLYRQGHGPAGRSVKAQCGCQCVLGEQPDPGLEAQGVWRLKGQEGSRKGRLDQGAGKLNLGPGGSWGCDREHLGVQEFTWLPDRGRLSTLVPESDDHPLMWEPRRDRAPGSRGQLRGLILRTLGCVH